MIAQDQRKPLLFAVIGSEIDFDKIPSSTLPKALAVTMIGVALRIPVAYAAVSGGYYTNIEKVRKTPLFPSPARVSHQR